MTRQEPTGSSSIEWPPPMELSELEYGVVAVTRPTDPAAAATPLERDATRRVADNQTPPLRLPWQTYALATLALIAIAEGVVIGIQYRMRTLDTAPAPLRASPVSVAIPVTAPATSAISTVGRTVAGSPVTNEATRRAAPAEAPERTAPAAAASSGWLDVRSSLDVDVWEGRRRLGASSDGRIVLDAGDHQLEFVNDTVGYRSTERVRIASGRPTAVAPAVPNGVLHLNAAPWADVLLNGQSLGTTPLANVRAPLGAHELVFRHPQLGSRTVRVLVTATAPARASVDMRQQP